ncbi:hypothetical protein BH11BAC1_BH11BAC1_16130 [soil metagenome]
MKDFNKILLLLIFAASLAGCEKQEYFKSESAVKKELGYSWKQVVMTRKYYSTRYEVWQFSGDSLIIKMTSDSLTENNLPPSNIFRGTYTVKTTMTKVYVNVSNFPDDEGSYYFNSEWNVVSLDSKILVIASEDPKAGGINEREFTRVD